MIIEIFIFLQIFLFLLMIVHDWVSLYPLNDIAILRKYHSKRELFMGSCINGSMVMIPLLISLYGYMHIFTQSMTLIMVALYGILTVGTMCVWWIPYIFGSSDAHKSGFKEYSNTHHFLPSRGTNLIPNSLHVIIHIHIWVAFFMSIYLFLKTVF